MQNRWILFFSTLCAILIWNAILTAAPLPPAPQQRLTFIGTADLQGHLEPSQSSIDLDGSGNKADVVGGISRIATLVKTIKRETQNPVITLSAGDDLMGRYFHFFNGNAIIDLLGVAGYEILALGNHEFDRGSGLLGEALEQTAFTTLCSDLIVKGTALENSCQSYFTKQYGTARVGFFSLMTPEFSYVTSGGDVSLTASTLVVAKRMVAKLKGKGVDLVVAVTHLGVELDRKIAQDVPGIDIIFGGHSHGYLHKLETVRNTLIVNGGEKGTALVRLDVTLDADNKLIPGAAKYSLVPITEAISEDPETVKRLHLYSNQLPADSILGKTNTAWHLDKNSLRYGESAVADMVNDLILNQFKVDVVLNNGGAFRGNSVYPAGPVTDSVLHEIDEFENDIFLLKIKGKFLMQIMEHSAASLGEGGFLQVAGVQVVIDTSAAMQEITQKDNKWKINTPGQQIVKFLIRDRGGVYIPVDPEKEYSVASNAFLAHKGGNKYYWFKEYGYDQINTYTTLYAVMAMELERNKVLSPPPPDGRIRLLTTHSGIDTK